MMKKKSPQEKRANSYAKDRRNAYGESDKASRKAIPLRKALVNRANRKRANQPLNNLTPRPNTDAVEPIELQTYHHRPKRWRKYPDAPLSEVVKKKLDRRSNLEEKRVRQKGKKKGSEI